MHPWFDSYEEIDINDLQVPMAQEFARFINHHGAGAAYLDGARRIKDGHELLLMRVATGRPQRPAYRLQREELIGVLFTVKEHYPYVMSAREDFPDTPHQNLVPPEAPYSLCIDDRSWREAKITYTPAELLHRIVLWFEKAGKGELHEAHQPLDPYFLGMAGTAILPGQVFEQGQDERCDLAVDLVDEKSGTVRLNYCSAVDLEKYKEQSVQIVFVTYEILPDSMSRLRTAPNNLALLHKEMESRGIVLFEDLVCKLRSWILEDDAWKQFRFCSCLGILVKLPIIHPKTGRTGAHSMIAFVTDCSLGDVGVSIGCLDKNDKVDGALKYVPKILIDPVAQDKLECVKLYPMNVVSSFEPYLAARMAGREAFDHRKVTMVGAGAVGSLVADTLSREGRFSWTIIDNDVLLPHNLARHALSSLFVGHPKALGLQLHLGKNVLGCTAEGIVADVIEPGEHAEKIDLALHSADIILDAAASVPVSRYLCDLSVSARRAAFFFNPTGTAAVLMVENEERAVDLRIVEAEFYSRILSNSELVDLLIVTPERLQYSGDCRAVTTRMPASRAQILGGLISQELGKALDTPQALLKIWKIADTGAVTVISYQPEQPVSCQIAEWKVRLLPSVVEHIQGMRCAKLPCETGGALMGVVDIPAKRIEVITALPPPPDSEEKPNEFVRGIEGLESMVKASMARTLDLIRYVGEWHSHPKGCGTGPSKIDLSQLAKLAETLSSDGCPGVQVISGDGELGISLLSIVNHGIDGAVPE